MILYSQNTVHDELVPFTNSVRNVNTFLDGVVKAYRENVMNPTATAVHGAEKN